MIIVVTGALGFIGQEVASRLLGRGHKVVLVDYWDRVIPMYEELVASEPIPILDSVYDTVSRAESLLRPGEFLTSLGSSIPDAIVHLGAVVDTADMGDSGTLFAENVTFTRDLVMQANLGRRADEIPGIVFASSAAVYGAKGFPNNPYGLSKTLGEKTLGRTRGDRIALRLFNVFGSTEHHKGPMASMPFKVARSYRTGRLIEMHSLDSARDFVPVTTVAEKLAAYAELFADRREHADLREPRITEVEDLGTGYATTFADLDNYIMQATGNVRSCVLRVPIPPGVAGRYQHYTCAGVRARNCGEGSQSTREAIEEIYGQGR